MADDLKNGNVEYWVPAQTKETVLSSRRKFTKSGIAGAAVVFSLANRSAWGTGNHHTHMNGCVSLLTSMPASFHPNSDRAHKLKQCMDQQPHKHPYKYRGQWYNNKHIDHSHPHFDPDNY